MTNHVTWHKDEIEIWVVGRHLVKGCDDHFEGRIAAISAEVGGYFFFFIWTMTACTWHAELVGREDRIVKWLQVDVSEDSKFVLLGTGRSGEQCE